MARYKRTTIKAFLKGNLLSALFSLRQVSLSEPTSILEDSPSWHVRLAIAQLESALQNLERLE